MRARVNSQKQENAVPAWRHGRPFFRQKKHGLYTKSGDARQREDIGNLSPACSLAQPVPGVFRGHLLKINEATNLCSERRGRGAARTLIRRSAGNGSETLRHIRLSFLACVPVVHDFQRGFKMHPGNFNLNARARSRVILSLVGFGFVMNLRGDPGRDQAPFQRLGFRR